MRAALFLFMVPVLAGCIDPDPVDGGFRGLQDTCGERPKETFFGGDHSKETIEYRFVSDGPFTVRVPAVLSEDGSTMQDWAAHVTDTATVIAVETARGPALEIAGEEDRIVIACTLQEASSRGNGCCAEQYLDGVWSMTPDKIRPEEIDVQVVEGTVTLYIEYHAESNWCGRDAHFNDARLGPGWHLVPGTDEAWCE